MKNLILILLLLITKNSICQIFINEVMALNTSTITDNDGNYSDWVEIYNSGPTQVDLANYYISDLETNLTKFQFTSAANHLIVPANGYLLLWASGNTTSGYNHTNFSLSSTNGEAIYLTAPDGITLVSSLVFPPQRENVSYGSITDGSSTVKFLSPASPSANNNLGNTYEGFLDPPIFSHQGGFFSQNFNLSLSHLDPNVSIIYTTDSSIPDPLNISGSSYTYKNSYPQNPGDAFGPFLTRSFSSSSYSSPILIQDKTYQENQISTISSTFDQTPNYIPNYLLKKGTVIRAIATKTGFLASNVATNTYIYSNNGNNPFNFPVVAVAAQENHLFDYYDGIYTAGVTFDNFRNSNPLVGTDFCTKGNFSLKGSTWERPANFELIETQNSVINQNLSFRIHGSCSTSFPYKSLRLYGVNKFDNNPIFPQSPNLLQDRIILRNSGNDYNQTLFKDVFVQKWMDHLNFSSQKSRQSILFLNGEYWGIHNIRDRIDGYFLNSLYGVDKDNLDLRSISWNGPDEIDEGDEIHYNNMMSFISSNDMSITSNYNTAVEMLDPENLIDYQISEIFIGNIDWPQNNVKLWRTRTSYSPNAPYGMDGRWRWILFDTDRALGELLNFEDEGLNNQINHPDNIIFKKLLENTSFKTQFINRYADLLNSSLKSSYSLPLFNSLKNLYSPEILTHINRWKNLNSISNWETKCQKVSNYIIGRPNSMFNQIINKFNLPGEYNLTLNTPDTTKGYIKVNLLEIKSSTKGLPSNVQTWTGVYFDNIPLKISAIPKPGYAFAYWLYNGIQVLDQTITINQANNVSYTAFFESAILSENPVPEIAANIASCGYKMSNWPASSTLGSSPANSKFVFLNQENPLITADIEGFTSGNFNLTSKTRINGLNENGFSFINTGSGNLGYPDTKLGGFLLAINTQNLDTVKISWTGRTITANPRKYKIRLYFREGDLLPFQNFSPAIEYAGSVTDGDFENFKNIKLPQELMDKPYVQLFWKYYYTGDASSGSRDELGIDDIKIEGVNVYQSQLTQTMVSTNNVNYIYNAGTIENGTVITNNSGNAIFLNPGFEAKNGSVFNAEISTCPNQ